MRYLLIVASIFLSFEVLGQTQAQLKSQIQYCKSETERLESELEKHKGLLAMQTLEVQELKTIIQDKDAVIVQLQIEKYELQQVAVNMINVALKFEKDGNYEAAMEVYKVLIKSFPNSLEAASSRIQIEDLRKNLKNK